MFDWDEKSAAIPQCHLFNYWPTLCLLILSTGINWTDAITNQSKVDFHFTMYTSVSKYYH